MQATVAALFLSLLVFGLPARAADWSASFPPAAVASHLETGGRAVLVAAAGGEGEAREAALALIAAMRASGKARLVMDGASLGTIAGLGDAEIVQRSGALPVEVVAVVRVFPGATDGAASVVVTLYDKKGAALVAFSTDEGKPLAAKEGSGAGGGVSTAAVQAVQKVEASPAARTARQTYEEQYLWFHDRYWVDPQTGGIVNRKVFACQGKNARELRSDEFYQLAGRPDLAARYRSAATRRSLFAWGGGAMMLGGLMLAPLSLSSLNCPQRDVYGQCTGRSHTLIFVGLGMAGVGLASLFVAGMTDPEPVPPHEARGLAEEHNRKLLEKLGLSAQRDSPPAPRSRGERPISLQVAAFPLREGGGVALGAQW